MKPLYDLSLAELALLAAVPADGTLQLNLVFGMRHAVHRALWLDMARQGHLALAPDYSLALMHRTPPLPDWLAPAWQLWLKRYDNQLRSSLPIASWHRALQKDGDLISRMLTTLGQQGWLRRTDWHLFGIKSSWLAYPKWTPATNRGTAILHEDYLELLKKGADTAEPRGLHRLLLAYVLQGDSLSERLAKDTAFAQKEARDARLLELAGSLADRELLPGTTGGTIANIARYLAHDSQLDFSSSDSGASGD